MSINRRSILKSLEETGVYFEKKSSFDIDELGSVLILKEQKSTILSPSEKCNSSPNTYSGNFGLGEFPFHTDLAHWGNPPRYIVLRCLCGVKGVFTSVINQEQILKLVSYEDLQRVFVTSRRPINRRHRIFSLMDKIDENIILRWDSLFLKPISKSSEMIFSQFSGQLKEVDSIKFELKNKGDLLIIDNWRTLHKRSAIKSSKSSKRKIERFYLGEIYDR